MKRKDQHSEKETAEKRRHEEVKEVAQSNSRLLSFNDEEDSS